jgi:hypothetical protein
MAPSRQPVTAEDAAAIEDLLAAYCETFDAGQAEAHVALWLKDGVLTGFGEPAHGHQGIAALVRQSFADLGGVSRHTPSNLMIDYEGGADQAVARGYNLVSTWPGQGADPGLMANIDETFRLQRTAGGWRFASVALQFT